jgi:hypothetical protein
LIRIIAVNRADALRAVQSSRAAMSQESRRFRRANDCIWSPADRLKA